jgi:glutaredoxin 3
MKAIVWSKEQCPYCEMSKQLLTSKGIVFEEKKIGSGYTKEDLLDAVPSARSVPQVFLDDKLIGGFKELQEYLTVERE